MAIGKLNLVCGFCGAHISEFSFRSGNKEYCCEGCVLKEMEFNEIKKERDSAHLSLVEALSSALDAREKETGLHSKRVACHTMTLAKRFTNVESELRQIFWGALLHDIGKIGVRDSILLKEGSLTPNEWVEMKRHPQLGYSILSVSPFFSEAAKIVLCHEERFDGSGYPNNLKGDKIPLGARLFAVIDTLDAMTSDRPYRKGMSFETARKEIMSGSGSQFDPVTVESFLAEEASMREMVRMKCQYAYALNLIGVSDVGGSQ